MTTHHQSLNYLADRYSLPTLRVVLRVIISDQMKKKHYLLYVLFGNKEQRRARTGGDVEEERVGGRGHVLPEEGEPHNHLQERTAQDSARPTGGAATAAQEDEGLQSVGGRVCHHTAQTGRI